MNVAVCTPSLNRPAELARLEASVRAQDYTAGIVRWSPLVTTAPTPLPELYARACLNAIDGMREEYGETPDAFLMLSDHLVLAPNAVTALMAAMGDTSDRVVGLNVLDIPPNPGIKEYCFVAVGRAFMEKHFWAHGVWPWCPEYWHFSAETELGEFASSLGKFTFAEAATAESFHPNWGKAPKDATFHESRKNRDHDARTRKNRGEMGLRWGQDFGMSQQPTCADVPIPAGDPGDKAGEA